MDDASCYFAPKKDADSASTPCQCTHCSSIDAPPPSGSDQPPGSSCDVANNSESLLSLAARVTVAYARIVLLQFKGYVAHASRQVRQKHTYVCKYTVEPLSKKGTASLQRTLFSAPNIFNLREEDKLLTKDKIAGPNVSFIRRFHCNDSREANA